MADAPDTLSALKKARDLIETRGYQPLWGKSGPLNTSNALTLACEDYETYCSARQCFSALWGGPLDEGLLSWETYKRRTKSEVLELFDQTIDRLEHGESNPEGPRPRVRSRRPV